MQTLACSVQELVVQSEIPYARHVTKTQIETNNNVLGFNHSFMGFDCSIIMLSIEILGSFNENLINK